MRFTKNARQAALRLAEHMDFRLVKESKTHVVVVSSALTSRKKLKSSPKKPISALGYMAYLAIDIYEKDPAEIADATRFHGNVPLDGMRAHERSALNHILSVSA